MTNGLVVDFLLLATSWTHVLLAPYSKVEESFNLHAAHDVLMYGAGPGHLHNYDHNVFPGAVPRTFAGSMILVWVTAPFVYFGAHLWLITSKFGLQIALRLSLATLNAIALILVRRAVSTHFGRRTSWLFALLTCSQFHLPFWMGRTLPNMFALVPVNIAYYVLYNRAPQSLQASKKSIDTALTLLTFTSVVFRSEVALLLAPLAFQLLAQGHTTFLNLTKVGLLAGLMSIAFTVAVDSYFWAKWPLWPELYGVYFNVYLGKSADWGTSPAHTYFTAYLPKLLLGASFLSVLGATLDHRIRSMLCAPVIFVLMLSALGHKEWRFVIYVVPLLNIAAARGTRWMTSRKKGFLFKQLSFLCALALIALNFIVTLASTRVSMANYPGGVALAAFNERYAGQKNIHLHISNLAAQTGASLFLHEYAPPTFLVSNPSSVHASWTYNKTESLTPSTIASSSFTHLIAESPEVADGEWKVVQSILGFKQWKLNMDVLNKLKTGKVWEVSFGECARVLEMEMTEQLWILERSGE
ncbi:glycosyltransferase family 22 protein [Paxillus rubicundulus Ve08.2h10]|uniref:Mannosyltransferase n=1 Tax=Paxillus rubicundulus Ve08.2h10 TaxID=930991 RepID=A0A0D0C8Y2_9AGAM|nr:glycosyltransferase family 22 protein [Paxillus rubicundulus Ve08.2h10]